MYRRISADGRVEVSLEKSITLVLRNGAAGYVEADSTPSIARPDTVDPGAFRSMLFCGNGGLSRYRNQTRMYSYLHRVRSFSPDIKLVLVYCLLANIGYGVIELIFNFYLLELGYREDFIGQWRAVSTLSVAAASLGLGAMINRFGSWRTMVAGFSALCLASFGLGLSSSSWLLMLLAVVYGASLAFLMNPVLPLIMDYERHDLRQYASAVSLSVVNLSLMIGSLMGGLAPDFFARVIPSISEGSVGAYRAAMLSGAGIAVLALIPLLFMKEPRHHRVERRGRANTADESPKERRQTRKDLGQFVLMAGLMSIGVGMIWPFYNVFLKSLGSSDDQVGYIFAISGLIAAVCGLVAPVVVARSGAVTSTLFLRLSVVPFFIPQIFMPTLGLAVLAFYWRSATASTAWPIEVTFISEVLPPRARAGVFGLRSSVWNLGYAAATYLGGLLIVARGYGPSIVSFVIFSTLSALVYFWYFSRHAQVRSGAITTAWSPHRRARLQNRSSRLEPDVGESDATATA
jgi:predicted MFS family arabinose efflux permease